MNKQSLLAAMLSVTAFFKINLNIAVYILNYGVSGLCPTTLF
jgi:hypothetical protein